jgi:hypothetical protein
MKADETQVNVSVGHSPRQVENIEGVKGKLMSDSPEQIVKALEAVRAALDVVWRSEIIYNVEGGCHLFFLTGKNVVREVAQ